MIEPLSSSHDISTFDCGTPELTDWLRRFALTNQQNGSARVFVFHRGGPVLGYYALAAGSVDSADAPARVVRGLAAHPIPVAILARLAVDEGAQGEGLGGQLLRHALLAIERAADTLGIRALLIHAKDEDARTFYERFDFERSPTDPLHLFLLLKDLRRALR